MDLRDAVVVAIRRWYAVGPLLILTLAGVWAAYTTGPTRYFSSAVMVLTVPPIGNTTYGDGRLPNHTNPLYLSDTNVVIASAMLAQEMSGREFALKIGLPGVGSAYLSVHNGAANPELLVTGPFLFINVDSDSPEEAQGFVRSAVAGARAEIQQWQADVNAPPTTSMTLVEILPPSSPLAGHGSRARAAAAALALGLIACYAAGVMADRILSVRRLPGAPPPLQTPECSCPEQAQAGSPRDGATRDTAADARGVGPGSRR